MAEKLVFENLQKYREAQIKTHLEKIVLLWFCGLTAKPLYKVCASLLQNNISLVAMGSRNGIEPRMFHEAGFSRCVGTDIAPTANIFPYMMEHDFHKPRPSFSNKFNCLYSNSFDHSYDLSLFLKSSKTWLFPESIIILDYSPRDNATVSGADCLAISKEELCEEVSNATNYNLLCSIKAPKSLGYVWPHYTELEHLVFASQELESSLKSSSHRNEKISRCVSEYEKLSQFKEKELAEYIKKMNLYQNEHLSYVFELEKMDYGKQSTENSIITF